MRVKGKRVLKNGTIAGYVYYPKEKKWKWRFLGKQQVGGNKAKRILNSRTKNNNNIDKQFVYLIIALKDFSKYLTEKPTTKNYKRNARKQLNSIISELNLDLPERSRDNYYKYIIDLYKIFNALKEYNEQKSIPGKSFENSTKVAQIPPKYIILLCGRLTGNTCHEEKITLDNNTSKTLLDVTVNLLIKIFNIKLLGIRMRKNHKNPNKKSLIKRIYNIRNKISDYHSAQMGEKINSLSNELGRELGEEQKKFNREANRGAAEAFTDYINPNNNAERALKNILGEKYNLNNGNERLHNTTKQYLDNAEASENPGATNENLREFAGQNTAEEVKKRESKYKNAINGFGNQANNLGVFVNAFDNILNKHTK